MQIDEAGTETDCTPAKIGSSVHAPVAVAEASAAGGEVQVEPSVDSTV